MKILIFIIFGCLSLALFDYMAKKISYIDNLFKNIREKTNNLNKKDQKKLRLVFFILMVLVCGISDKNKIGTLIRGLAFGIIISARDLCFEKN